VIAAQIGIFLAAAVGTTALGMVSSWVDRKVTARVQWRVGPPLLQPVYDVAKLFAKETLISRRAQGRGFLIAPVLGFAAAAVAAAMLWWANLMPAAGGFVGDFIVVVYVLTIPAVAMIYGGLASGSPHAALGSSREMKLLLSYELPLILSALVPIVQMARMAEFGWSFSLGDIVASQQAGGAFGATIWSLSGVLAFVVALLCIQAKLTLVPFDLPEAETELMGGSALEYSGPPLGMLKLTRMLLLAVAPIYLATLFLGGLGDWPVASWLLFALKYVIVLVLIVLIRNTNPRLRIDHAVKLFWFGLTPIAIVALVLAAVGL
jgi:NADH-quinone oxidoreductase subunit H